MTITLTAPAADVELDGTGLLTTTAVEGDDWQVWVTEVGGPRVVDITAAVVSASWSERLESMPSSSASLEVERYALLDDEDPGSWVVAELSRVEREVQIVHRGRVVFWGPVISLSRTVGGATVEVSCAGAEWWFGVRLIANVNEDVFGVDQIRPPAVFDPARDVVTDPFEWGTVVWFDRSDWRFTADVWVDSSVPDDTVILRAEVPSEFTPTVAGMVRAGSLTRDAWTTAVVRLSSDTGGNPGRPITLTVAGVGAGTGDVLCREVTAQVSPLSVGLGEMAEDEAEFFSTQAAWLEVVANVADLGFVGEAESEGAAQQAGWRRPDVFASEAARLLTEIPGGQEVAMALHPTVRVAQLLDIRGVEHDPGTLTLDTSTVAAFGAWQSGVGRPVSEWVVANDEGFTGSYHDASLFGGLRLQEFIAAPTGTSASTLRAHAEWHASQAATTFSEEITADVEMAHVTSLQLGDRVWVTIDDGPDQWDGLMRVMSRTVDPSAASFAVALVPWVEP